MADNRTSWHDAPSVVIAAVLCPACGHEEHAVLSTVPRGRGRWKRCRCGLCSEPFTVSETADFRWAAEEALAMAEDAEEQAAKGAAVRVGGG